jgi:hypothetical protein
MDILLPVAIAVYSIIAVACFYVFHKWEKEDEPHGWYY